MVAVAFGFFAYIIESALSKPNTSRLSPTTTKTISEEHKKTSKNRRKAKRHNARRKRVSLLEIAKEYFKNRKIGYKIKRINLYSVRLGKRVPIYILKPKDYEQTLEVYPVVILMGGASEAMKGQLASARYWIYKTRLVRNLNAFSKGRLATTAYLPRRAAELFKNWLKTHSFPKMIVVLPHTELSLTHKYAAYIVKDLLTYIKNNYRVYDDKDFFAIDGACLGGAQALYIGMMYPNKFGIIAGIQPAIRDYYPELYTALIDHEHSIKLANPNFHLISSYGDPYLESVRKFGRILKRKGLKTTVSIYYGPHTYRFYSGAGSIGAFMFYAMKFYDAWIKKYILPEELANLK